MTENFIHKIYTSGIQMTVDENYGYKNVFSRQLGFQGFKK